MIESGPLLSYFVKAPRESRWQPVIKLALDFCLFILREVTIDYHYYFHCLLTIGGKLEMILIFMSLPPRDHWGILFLTEDVVKLMRLPTTECLKAKRQITILPTDLTCLASHKETGLIYKPTIFALRQISFEHIRRIRCSPTSLGRNTNETSLLHAPFQSY